MLRNIYIIIAVVAICSCNKNELEPDQVYFQGQVVDKENNIPLEDVIIDLEGTGFQSGSHDIIKTGPDGYFKTIITKNASYDVRISHPDYLDQEKCINYREECLQPRKNDEFQFSLDPAGYLKMDLINSSGSPRIIRTFGSYMLYIGKVTQDSVVYKKVEPGTEHLLSWVIYEDDDHVTYLDSGSVYYTVPKFDTISFDIHF